MKHLVFDIGGTNLRSAVYDSETGKLIGEPKVVPTPSLIREPDAAPAELQVRLIDTLVATIGEYRASDTTITTVGLSIPGPVTSTGTIRFAPSLWGREEDYPLGDILRTKLPDLQFVVANDLSAAASYYALRPEHHTEEKEYAEVITVSTGVGGKVFSRKNGKIKLDSAGIGGEFGHVRLNYDAHAITCNCGCKGDLNAESSGTGIAKRTRMKVVSDTARFADSQLPALLAEKLGLDQSAHTSAEWATLFTQQSDAVVNEVMIQALKKTDSTGAPKEQDDFAREILDYTTQFMVRHMEHAASGIGITRFIFIGGFAKALGEEYRQSVLRNLNPENGHFLITNVKTANRDSLVIMGHEEKYEGLLGMGIMATKAFPTPTTEVAAVSSIASPFLETGKFARTAGTEHAYGY